MISLSPIVDGKQETIYFTLLRIGQRSSARGITRYYYWLFKREHLLVVPGCPLVKWNNTFGCDIQVKTVEEHQKLVQGILKRDKKRRKKIEAAGIDYECPEIVRKRPLVILCCLSLPPFDSIENQRNIQRGYTEIMNKTINKVNEWKNRIINWS